MVTRHLRGFRTVLRAVGGDVESRHRVSERFARFVDPAQFYGERGKTWSQDSVYRALFQQYRADEIDRRLDRLWTLSQFAKVSAPLGGDLAEVGVFEGASAIAMLAFSSTARYWGYDSFEGLSAPDPELDGTYWSVGDMATAEHTAVERLQSFDDRVVLVKGWVPDCFEMVEGPSRLSLSHIDVDLFDPTLAALQYVASRTLVGGFIVCDDYGFASCPGATRAVDEFVAATPCWTLLHLPTGQAVLQRLGGAD